MTNNTCQIRITKSLMEPLMPQMQRSFHEFMPSDVWKWKIIENRVDHLMALYDYHEIRLSILQDYSVLHKGITALMNDELAGGVANHVLNLDGPDHNISLLSLRPEGTISVLHHTARMIEPEDIYRFYYHGPMFRKDKDMAPMEFYQLGVEFLGSDSILSENEVICLGMKLCQHLGLQDVFMEINSYGCEDCYRPFKAAMRSYLEEHNTDLCQSCLSELYANPVACTQCAREACGKCLQDAPPIVDYLCPKCKQNFIRVKQIQANLAHKYVVNSKLVKNFSYYNETVFDFILHHKGEKLVIGGGGRYDYLAEKITHKKIPAVGFYLNLDTIFEVMEYRKIFQEESKAFSVYICAQSEQLEIMILQIATEMHEHEITTILSTDNLDTETEKKAALKKGCSLMIVLRDSNIREGKLLLFNLVKNHPQYVPLNQLMDEILVARKALI